MIICASRDTRVPRMQPQVYVYAVLAFVVLWIMLGGFFWVVFQVIRRLDARAEEHGPYERGL